MRRITIALALLSTLFGTPAGACEQAKLVKVIDGDTFIAWSPIKGILRVRMEAIDAPEKTQPFGKEAQEHLKDLLEGNKLTICLHGKDVYGRDLGTAFVGNVDPSNPNTISANQKMVMDGFAWSYRSKPMHELETTARIGNKGLWADSNAENPGDYRRRIKRERTSGYPLEDVPDTMPLPDGVLPQWEIEVQSEIGSVCWKKSGKKSANQLAVAALPKRIWDK